jgi:hypothetical protein
LAKGGRAGFTVWGDRERSNAFTLLDKAFLAAGVKVEETNVRSHFHLNKKKKLVNMLKESGFGKIQLFEQYVPMNYFNEEDIEIFLKLPDSKRRLESLDHESRSRVIVETRRVFHEIWRRNECVGFEALCAVCEKIS